MHSIILICLVELMVEIMVVSPVPLFTRLRVRATVDDGMTLYADGELVGTNGRWDEVSDYNLPYNTRVIAVRGENAMTAKGIFVQIDKEAFTPYMTVEGFHLTEYTDSNWKCTASASAGWTHAVFDDSSWGSARVIGSCSDSPWGICQRYSGLSENTKWIWTLSDHTVVYCRSPLLTACDPDCKNGGTLDTKTCTCDCGSLWIGDTCQSCFDRCQNGGQLDTQTCTCDCTALWTGNTCQTCNDRCQNGGQLNTRTCTCACAALWTGNTCQTCNVRCQNGEQLNTRTCTCECAALWAGNTCQTCNARCQNGGQLDTRTCTCECATLWTGNNCQTCNDRCQNGGQLNTRTCTCECTALWTGNTCQTCNARCQNGGQLNTRTCTCECAALWTGNNCQTCNAGCQNWGEINTRTCTCECAALWTGNNCQTCSARCQNGGQLNAKTCTCDCAALWTGNTCLTCNARCQNGGQLSTRTCTCECAELWTGNTCQTCNARCQNGGQLNTRTCTCECAALWSDTTCQTCNARCKNGGQLNTRTCTCDCKGYWTGNTCEICSAPCENWGQANKETCICDCLMLWTGNTCQTCNARCENGGQLNTKICFCDCTSLWSGNNCQTCNTRCNNGGQLNTTTCACNCVGRWTGSICNDCQIQCQNGGTINTRTCSCNCNENWVGQFCEVSLSRVSMVKIYSTWPGRGPVAGGTKITLHGNNLPVDYNMTLWIGVIPCATVDQNSTTVTALTPNLNNNNVAVLDELLPLKLQFSEDYAVNTGEMFAVMNNPVVEHVYPLKTILEGGTKLTVTGNNFESVARPIMQTTVVIKRTLSIDPLRYNSSTQVYFTNCEVHTPKKMICITPFIRVPGLTQRNTTNEYPESRKRRSSPDNGAGVGDTHEKIEYTSEGYKLEFYIGFKLDGVDIYDNFTAIDVFYEPEFDIHNEIINYEHGMRLFFKGDNLDVGLAKDDYVVTIGSTGFCEDFELLSNSLSCSPPGSNPDQHNTTDLVEIMIHVGLNVDHRAGHLRYLQADEPNGIGILLIVSIVISCAVALGLSILGVVLGMKKCRQRQPPNKETQHDDN